MNIIPANCQIRAGGHTITFNCDQHPNDPLRAAAVIELDGRKPDAGSYMPPVLMRELSAMILGVHPDQMPEHMQYSR